MKRHGSTLFIAILLWICPVAASADGDFSRNALYVRGGLTAGFDAAIILAEVDVGVGVGGALGYRIHPRLGLEGQFEWQGNQTVTLFSTTGELSRWNATGNVKVFLATGRVQPYALVGLGYTGATGTCTSVGCSGSGTTGSFLARFGAGLDIYITRNIGVYAEGAYMLAPTDVVPGESYPDYGTVGAGVILAF